MNTTEKLVEQIIKGLQEVKGENIVSLDMSPIVDPICKYFVICEANSSVQVSALAHSVEKVVKEQLDEKPISKAGFEQSQWIALDYGDVMVHVFQAPFRAFYDLEHLWADATITSHEG